MEGSEDVIDGTAEASRYTKGGYLLSSSEWPRYPEGSGAFLNRLASMAFVAATEESGEA
jgi:hypothetical protein